MEVPCQNCGKHVIPLRPKDSDVGRCPECYYLLVTPASQEKANENIGQMISDRGTAAPPPQPIPVPLTVTTRSCPICLEENLSQDTRECPVCQYNFNTMSRPKKVRGNLFPSIFGATLGAALGAGIWAWISYTFEYEFNYVAGIVGAFAGVGAAISTREKSQTVGFIAALISIVGVFAGSYIGHRLVVSSPEYGEYCRTIIRDNAEAQIETREQIKALQDIETLMLRGSENRETPAEFDKRVEGMVDEYMRSEEVAQMLEYMSSYSAHAFGDPRAILFFASSTAIGLYCAYRAGAGSRKPDMFA